jgi:hypothetical protein
MNINDPINQERKSLATSNYHTQEDEESSQNVNLAPIHDHPHGPDHFVIT